jgi:hypothetical protein
VLLQLDAYRGLRNHQPVGSHPYTALVSIFRRVALSLTTVSAYCRSMAQDTTPGEESPGAFSAYMTRSEACYFSWSSGAFQLAMFQKGRTKLGPFATLSLRTRFDNA